MAKSIKDEIKAHYGEVARKVTGNAKASCCQEPSCCCDAAGVSVNLYPEDFIEGLPEEAISASLGCANPIALADLQKGETVLDLGSGGGIDVLISSKYVGETGKVYGLDMTDEMLDLAKQNKEKSGVKNVEFLKGYIEDIPLADETVDVVMSNCVINLSESKEDVLKEAYRVLKKGGRFAVADIIELKAVPDEIKQSVQMWVGCVSGAMSAKEYERILKEAGFTDIEIEPVHIYTKDVIRSLAESHQLGYIYEKLDETALDGAFAGAHVKARKSEEANQ